MDMVCVLCVLSQTTCGKLSLPAMAPGRISDRDSGSGSSEPVSDRSRSPLPSRSPLRSCDRRSRKRASRSSSDTSSPKSSVFGRQDIRDRLRGYRYPATDKGKGSDATDKGKGSDATDKGKGKSAMNSNIRYLIPDTWYLVTGVCFFPTA